MGGTEKQRSRLIGVCCLVLLMFAASRRSAAQGPICHQHPNGNVTERTPSINASADAQFSRGGQIRLNYVRASWKSVLEDLARSMGANLVVPELPPGHYSRVDWRDHSVADAVGILNRELEPKGYQLLAKGPYLIVLDLQSTRPEYRPAAVSASETRPSIADPSGLEPRKFALRGSPISRRSENQRLSPLGAMARHDSYPVRQAAHLEPASAHDDTTRFNLHIERQSAAAVADQILRACRSAATPVGGGPHASSAFLVDFSTPRTAGRPRLLASQRPRVRFSVAVDKQRNELLVEAPSRLADAVTRLVRSFETMQVRPGHTARVVASAGDVHRIARNLCVPFNTLLAFQNAERDTQKRQPPAANKPAPAGQPKEPSRAGGVVGDLDAVIQELRGDVSVEAIEDLRVLIVRGDQNDVDAVVSLVREIQKLGVGAAPEIHLRLLSHVNSQGLTDLLSGVFGSLGRRGSGAARPGVSITPVVKPNAIVIVAPQSEMPAILELADKLDQPGDPRLQFRVFALENAVASQVLQLVEDFYDDKGGMAVRIKAVIDARTNSLIVQGAPTDLDEVAALVQRIDHDESKSVSEMRIFPLKNAVAEELADVINTAIQSVLSDAINPRGGAHGPAPGPSTEQAGGAAGTSRRFQAAKSVVLQFLTSDGTTERRVRSGILEDIRVTSDARSNSLVVTAPEQSMRLMTELIRQLDQPTSMVAEIKVFTLTNADATAMARLLESLFDPRSQQQDLGVQLAGADDASSNLIPMRFSVDTRTNSILATGGAEALRVIEAILMRLDQSDLRQRKNTVYRLKNSPAEDVAKAINQFLTSQRDLAQLDPNLVSTVELLEREVIVVAEPVSNSLLISSTPRYYDEILGLAEQLDEPPPQVVIQALLVEVALDNDDEFGVELGLQDSVLFDRSAISDVLTVTDTVFDAVTGLPVSSTERIVSQSANPGFAFNNQPLGNNPAINTSRVGGQGLSNFSLGRVNDNLGYGGLVLSAGSESVSVLIRALAARRRVNVLSRPQIRTLDNQQAEIQVGKQTPIVDGVSVNATGSANPVVRQDKSGIILNVTPRISPDEVIVMEVVAEKSAYVPGNEVALVTSTDAEKINTIFSPVKDIITARTTVSVPNGQTIVLGGMITTTDGVTERKVPWLGDLPILGRAFRHDRASSDKNELLIFLTPRIVHNSLDSEMMKQIETSRISFCEGCAEAVHGPLYAVPEEGQVTDELPLYQPPMDE